jgi:hypothetical protein
MSRHFFAGLGMVIGFAVCLNACNPEEYGPCSIPDTTAYKQACSPQGDQKTATCAADYVFDCDSLICGRYDSSDAFCTYRCVPNADECNHKDPKMCECPAGKKCKSSCPEGAACVEWIPGTSNYYCLPASKGTAPDRGRNDSTSPSTTTPSTSSCTAGDKKCVTQGSDVFIGTCDGTEYKYTDADKCENGCAADGKSCEQTAAPSSNEIACDGEGTKCVIHESQAWVGTCVDSVLTEATPCQPGANKCNASGDACEEESASD